MHLKDRFAAGLAAGWWPSLGSVVPGALVMCLVGGWGGVRAHAAPQLRVTVEDGRVMANYQLEPGTVGSVLRFNSLESSGWEVAALVGVGSGSGRFELPATGDQAFFRIAAKPRPVLPDLVWIEAGRFVMGSDPDEFERQVDEGPAREVTIASGFWMARCEVTTSEYASRMGLPAPDPAFARRAVCDISWREALLFCEELNRLQAASLPVGYAYRLPTEAEWEYAARAGTQTRYSFGNDHYGTEINEYAWWGGNSTGIRDVGTKRANPWGLHDMHGNVFEWCMDLYQSYPGGVTMGSAGPHHISRGGSNYCPARYLRSASRHHFSAERYPLVGFRVVLAPRMEWVAAAPSQPQR